MSPDEVISSAKNAAVATAVRLHRARHRRSEGLTLIEGPWAVLEAAQAGIEIRELFGLEDTGTRSLAAEVGVELRLVTESVLRRLAGTENPRGPIAVVETPDSTVPAHGRMLVPWEVSDPGNCGTLLRTAAAFGYGFATGPACADSWSPKVLRSAAGGHFRTTVGEILAVEDLGRREIIGTVPTGGEPAGGVGPDAAIIVGNEAHGLPPEVIGGCDRLVSIPMPGGSESLNAAVAGAIVAYLGAIRDDGR